MLTFQMKCVVALPIFVISFWDFVGVFLHFCVIHLGKTIAENDQRLSLSKTLPAFEAIEASGCSLGSSCGGESWAEVSRKMT